MRGVVAHSSNIGTALLTRQMNKQKLHDYLERFGLGATTGIELPGESSGIVPPADMTDVHARPGRLRPGDGGDRRSRRPRRSPASSTAASTTRRR